MFNLIDYVKWRGDLTFNENKFNLIDGCIFSSLTFINLTTIVGNNCKTLKEAYNIYFKENDIKKLKLGLIVPKENLNLCKIIKDANRFSDILVSNYDSIINLDKKEQFCAETFHLNDDTMIIAFQGTDDTLVGWEENFDMISEFPISAQQSAVNYTKKIMSLYPNKQVILCGHSKGGNLAMYAGIFCDNELKDRIIKIINYDGPGFEQKNIDTDKYNMVKDNITTVLPERSVVGMLFTQLGTVIPVKSNGRGLYQHDTFTWFLQGNSFIRVNNISKESQNISNEITALINNMDEERRKQFCDSLSKFLKGTNTQTLLELNSKKLRAVQSYRNFSSADRVLFLKLLRVLIVNRAFN